MSNVAKFKMPDGDMLELLRKYPFLKYRKMYGDGGFAYDTDKENLANNWYKAWDGTGWENLWKNRYLPRLFALYDGWDEERRNGFHFLDVKSKMGRMTIYTSVSTGEDSLEGIAAMVSEWTCEGCGKEPRDTEGRRVIWSTNGWIANYCEDCLKKFGRLPENYTEADVDALKQVRTSPFAYVRFAHPHNLRIVFKETDDGWLVRDRVEKEG